MTATSKLPPTASPWPHRWGWALACATFPLVWWGGWVVASGSGMAFRDWLTSDGVAMPLYPWLSSAGDKFIEHGHRLLGMVAGLLSIALVVSAYMAGARPAVKRYAWLLLAGVIAQGVLGGLRVVLDQRVAALIHGVTGPLFFAAAAGFVVVTSRGWEQSRTLAQPTAADRKLTRLAIICTGLTFGQLTLGVVVRHSALMIRDGSAALFEAASYLHALTAVAVIIYLTLLTVRAWRTGVAKRLTMLIQLLIIAQFALGLTTWLFKYGVPAWVAQYTGEVDYLNREAESVRALVVTGHGAAGSLLVALTVAVALYAGRRTGIRRLTLPSLTASGRVLA